MNKNCKNCNVEFTPLNYRGSEQIYCSVKCRNNASIKRHKENLINSIKEQYEPKEKNETLSGTTNNNFDKNSERTYYSRPNTDFVSDRILGLMEHNYETKSDLIEFKLRNEMLQKQLQELEIENSELLQELEEISNGDNKTNSIISGVMQQFKQDPQGTITFATELINGFLKPKTNAEN